MNKLAIPVLAAMVWGGVQAWGQTAGTAPGRGTGPAQSASATQPLTATMKFQFENASIDTVLNEMSARFGFVIQRTVPLTGKVSVMVPQPVSADEAITLLNSLLVPLGYAAVEKPALEQADGRMARVLRVMTWERAKKEAPVSGG
jgi:hypothetical protein